jgi:dihydroorotase
MADPLGITTPDNDTAIIQKGIDTGLKAYPKRNTTNSMAWGSDGSEWINLLF